MLVTAEQSAGKRMAESRESGAAQGVTHTGPGGVGGGCVSRRGSMQVTVWQTLIGGLVWSPETCPHSMRSEVKPIN